MKVPPWAATPETQRVGLRQGQLALPANVFTTARGIASRARATRDGGFTKGAVPRRVNATTAEAVLLSMGYKVFRETFDLVAVRHLENGKRFHTRIEAHGAPEIPRGAEVDVHIDYLAERSHSHGSLAESESIRIEMESLVDFLTAAKPSRGKPGFLACPMCGKEMAEALFETHRKVTHR